MRHVYIRAILALIWLAAAIVTGTIFYVFLGLVFLYSAHALWKKGKNDKGED